MNLDGILSYLSHWFSESMLHVKLVPGVVTWFCSQHSGDRPVDLYESKSNLVKYK